MRRCRRRRHREWYRVVGDRSVSGWDRPTDRVSEQRRWTRLDSIQSLRHCCYHRPQPPPPPPSLACLSCEYFTQLTPHRVSWDEEQVGDGELWGNPGIWGMCECVCVYQLGRAGSGQNAACLHAVSPAFLRPIHRHTCEFVCMYVCMRTCKQPPTSAAVNLLVQAIDIAEPDDKFIPRSTYPLRIPRRLLLKTLLALLQENFPPSKLHSYLLATSATSPK